MRRLRPSGRVIGCSSAPTRERSTASMFRCGGWMPAFRSSGRMAMRLLSPPPASLQGCRETARDVLVDAHAEVVRRARWAMEMVGLPFDAFKDRETFALSGGEKRKVALAGILVLQPQILVLDEPTAGLDPRSRHDLLARIRRLNRDEGLTVVFVSHNMDEVALLADRVYVMADGRVAMCGTPKEIFADAGRLAEHRIGMPETVEILHRLRALGYDVDTRAFEAEASAREILGVIGAP
ncbi:MAG: ATP-binding cassette domain-containing protein, partial [Chloroflexi bacterium]|nr:ATP-binding cassette domain-containing protein [Chloroflexota bacterium]